MGLFKKKKITEEQPEAIDPQLQNPFGPSGGEDKPLPGWMNINFDEIQRRGTGEPVKPASEKPLWDTVLERTGYDIMHGAAELHSEREPARAEAVETPLSAVRPKLRVSEAETEKPVLAPEPEPPVFIPEVKAPAPIEEEKPLSAPEFVINELSDDEAQPNAPGEDEPPAKRDRRAERKAKKEQKKAAREAKPERTEVERPAEKKPREKREKQPLITDGMPAHKRNYIRVHIITASLFMGLGVLASLLLVYFFIVSGIFSIYVIGILVFLSLCFAAACVYIFIKYLYSISFEYDAHGGR